MLSILVVLSERYLQRLEEKFIALSFVFNTKPKIFKRFIDDGHTIFEKKKSLRFFETLNKYPSNLPLIWQQPAAN